MSPRSLPSEILDGRGPFLAFLRARLGSDDEAEEVLQAAYLKGMRSRSAPKGEVRAWFFRVLRSALIDHYRRRAARAKHEGEAAREKPLSARDEDKLEKAVCRCMHDLMPGLKPEYKEILRRAELEEEPLPEVAKRLGLTRNNATVRLHRARRSLKEKLLLACGACAAHGCLDCSCRRPQGQV